MTARAWRYTVQNGMMEEEHETHKSLAIFQQAPRLMGRGTVPYRGARPAHPRSTRQHLVHLDAPAQTQRPRAMPVWCPLRLAPDGDDPRQV
ncbi:hypothetical protein P2318_26520 [Myxococcaceae bacterium GXIMD 01537]